MRLRDRIRKHRSSKHSKKKQSRDINPTLIARFDSESTGAEAVYLKSLITLKTQIVVVLKTGEQLRGQLKYYDRDIFGLGPNGGGPKLVLRKSSVRYIYEEAV